MVAGLACERDAGPVRHYVLNGTIVSLRKETRMAMIRHEDVKDGEGKVWMAAMTMEFPVRDEAAFPALQAGQRIRANLHQRESDFDYWIDGIQIVAASEPSEPGK
jgi:Cu/Ag efflux protein CusF